MNGSYMLPGGTVESGEDSYLALVRELEEELGLTVFDNVSELINIDYYHDGFPKYKSNGFERRLNSVYYYVVMVDSRNIGESHFTEYEKSCNDRIETVSLSEVSKLFENLGFDNKWKKFTNLELQIILDYFSSVNQINNYGNKSTTRK